MTQSAQPKKRGRGNTNPTHTRNRNWCFTLNNYTADEIDEIKNIANTEYAFQEEKGANGTPHLQGVLFFKNARTLASVKKMIPRAHLEIMKGTKNQAVAYATKDDTRNGDIHTNMDLTKMTHTTQVKLCYEKRLEKSLEENRILAEQEFYNTDFNVDTISPDLMSMMGYWEQKDM